MAPSLLLSSCKKESDLPEIAFEGRVIIIGAGAAGIYAGSLLKSRDIDFQILEASGLVGGRLGRLNGFADFPLDTGANLLRGQKSVLAELAKSADATLHMAQPSPIYWFEDSLRQTLPNDPYVFNQPGLPDISYKAHAAALGLDERFDAIVDYIAARQGSSASRLSAFWAYQESESWSAGNLNFIPAQGLYDLMGNHLLPGVLPHISTNTVVKTIDYSHSNIIITDTIGRTYSAEKVIITVPISVLRDADIEFFPELPTAKTEAFSRIGMDGCIKVFMKFSAPFYTDFVVGGKVCNSYFNEQVGKSGQDNILSGVVVGEQAEALEALGSEEAISAKLLEELDQMYNGRASQRFIEARVINWTKHPFIRGGFSYSGIGIGNARQILAAPIDNKLFFAGEASSINGHHQTLHGAMESGFREVLGMLNSAR